MEAGAVNLASLAGAASVTVGGAFGGRTMTVTGGDVAVAPRSSVARAASKYVAAWTPLQFIA